MAGGVGPLPSIVDLVLLTTHCPQQRHPVPNRSTLRYDAEECSKDLIGSLVGTSGPGGLTIALQIRTEERTLTLQSDGVGGLGEGYARGAEGAVAAASTAASAGVELDDLMILRQWFHHVLMASGRHGDESRAAIVLQTQYRTFVCRSRYEERRRLVKERNAKNKEWLKRKERDQKRHKNAPKGRRNLRARAKEVKRKGGSKATAEKSGAAPRVTSEDASENVIEEEDLATTADAADNPSAPRATRWLRALLSPTCARARYKARARRARERKDRQAYRAAKAEGDADPLGTFALPSDCSPSNLRKLMARNREKYFSLRKEHIVDEAAKPAVAGSRAIQRLALGLSVDGKISCSAAEMAVEMSQSDGSGSKGTGEGGAKPSLGKKEESIVDPLSSELDGMWERRFNDEG